MKITKQGLLGYVALTVILYSFLRVTRFVFPCFSKVAIEYTADTALGESLNERRTKCTRCNARRFLKIKVWRNLSALCREFEIA